jgi:peptidoglycan/xylan/chitin deacetylase (PgdA/CDA1 family)
VTEHDLFAPSSIAGRPALRWPEGKGLAFAILLSLEYYEMQPPPGAFIPPNVPGMFGRGPYPDIGSFSRREYGNRVGFFRLRDLLAQLAFPVTAAMDATIAGAYPEIVAAARAQGWEFAGHGLAVTQVISSTMTEADERAYIRRSLDAVERASGTKCQGWHGPEYGESTRTPALLREAGLSYLMDWPNDEQPYRMKTPAGEIVSLPVAMDQDDVYALWQRKLPIERWCAGLEEAVARLAADGRESGRVLVLNLHPWLIGHPHRISQLRKTLGRIRARDDVWFTNCGAIVDGFTG